MTAALSRMRDAPLVSASRLLAERGFYGIIWVNSDLAVSARYGDLVGFVDVGAPLTDSLLPFAGMEQDLLTLVNKPHSVLDVPSVTIFTKHDRTPRLNLAAVWSQSEQSILVLVSRAVLSSDLEVELNRQIRARLIAEADVVAKSVELQRANGDLQQFASIISHDLKAPMRELRFLADDADTLLAAGDIDQARQTLLAMRQQSRRMSDMMSSLLGYVTAAQRSEALEDIDTAALVTTIVESLPRPAGMTINIDGRWPKMTTLAALLDLVLRNLIDNAISHHDKDTGIISVAVVEEEEALEISVTDDGPGIPPEHQTAIFLPFRTLAAAGANASSSGMGLAIVERALSSIGGSINVASDAPKTRGTSFRVRWPKTISAMLKNRSTSPLAG
ncbi:MAG: HAMP domain-containing sensor histidine kinase [Hyphomicrobiaceae bacterium]|nr:HAMP domain-containing sensor histidine kinase [Hyphomicrobiaceae bacterium]